MNLIISRFFIVTFLVSCLLLLTSPIQAQTASPCNYTDLSAHEQTLTKFNCFTQPKELATTVPSQNPSFFSQWLNTAQAVLNYFGFKSSIKNQQQFSARADQEHAVTLPKEVQAETTNKVVQTGEDLGTNATANSQSTTGNVQAATSKDDGVGIYQVTQPKELQKTLQKVCDYEKNYESSWFPKGLTPVSGDDCQ